MKLHYYVVPIAAGLVVAVALYTLSLRHPVDPISPPIVSAGTPAVQSQARSAAINQTPEATQNVRSEPLSQKIDPLAELKRRLDDPQEHATNLLRAKLNVEQTCGRLFQRLRNLPPEVLDRLKTALAEKQLAMERGSLPDHMPVDDAEANAGKEKLDRIQAAADGQIQAILGDDAYEQYNFFQQSEPYRESIEQVTSMMRSRGGDVSDDMQEKILAGYTSALVAAAKVSANDTTPEAFQTLSDSARQELRAKQQSRFDETLASTMSKILSPAEYKLFMDSELAQGASSP